MSCFIMFQSIGSAVQWPCLMHASGFGMTSGSSVQSTLSTGLGASGMCFLSPRIYAGSRVAR